MDEDIIHDEQLLLDTKHQSEIEKLRQIVHDYKNHIKALEFLQKEYQEEVRCCVEDKLLLIQQLQTAQDAKVDLEKMHTERQESYENELRNRDNEIENFKRKLDDARKESDIIEQPVDDERLLDEITNLRGQNLKLTEALDEKEELFNSKEKQCFTLEGRIEEVTDELEHYKEMADCKKKELEEAQTLVNNLKDDYLCVKSELAMVNSKPLDTQSRGNSLFAEVDDRRVQLQQNVNTMKSQYLEMKRERVSHMKQISTLQNENAALIARWEAEIEGARHDEEMIIESLKEQVRTLTALIENYKKELKEKSNADGSPTHGIKFFNNMLSMKNDEIEQLKQDLSAKSQNNTTLTYDLVESRKQIRKKDLEILRVKNDYGQLKIKIEEMSVPITPVELKPPEKPKMPKSIFKCTKKEEQIEETEVETNKENKTVQFSEATVDSHVTERSKGRRGVKVLTSKPIKYF